MAKANEKTATGAKRVIVGMHEVLKGLKEQRKALGPRKLSPEGSRKQALGRLLSAMERRGWEKVSPRQYKLGAHSVVTTDANHVLVDEVIRLDLGKGAIADLDRYVKDRADLA